MAGRTYVAEVTDPVTQETIVLEAPTESELDRKLDELLPDEDDPFSEDGADALGHDVDDDRVNA